MFDNRTNGKEEAKRLARAVNEIVETLEKSLDQLSPMLSTKYGLEDQMLKLAISQAAFSLAVTMGIWSVGLEVDDGGNAIANKVRDLLIDEVNKLRK